jgi:hypothetical protein
MTTLLLPKINIVNLGCSTKIGTMLENDKLELKSSNLLLNY